MRKALLSILHATDGFARAAGVEGKRIAQKQGVDYVDDKHWDEGAAVLENRFLELEAEFKGSVMNQAKAFVDAELAVEAVMEQDTEDKPDPVIG